MNLRFILITLSIFTVWPAFGEAGRKFCFITGKVQSVEENDRLKARDPNWTRYSVTLEDLAVVPSDYEGCANVHTSDYSSIESNNFFVKGQRIRISLSCHYLGRVGGCELSAAEIVNNPYANVPPAPGVRPLQYNTRRTRGQYNSN